MDKSKVGKLSIVCESLECTQSEVNNLKKQNRNATIYKMFSFSKEVFYGQFTIDRPLEICYSNSCITESNMETSWYLAMGGGAGGGKRDVSRR